MIRSKIASRFQRATTMGFLWGLLALLLHLVPGAVDPARGQGTRKDDIVFNTRGTPLAGATVRVCVMPASGQPCTPLALIYSDSALTQALANPTTTDGLGNYFFYAAPGKYEIEISGPSITTKQIPNVILPNDPASPTFSGAVSAFSLSLTGNLTVTGNTTVIGNLASGTVNLTNQGTPPGAAGSGTVNLYTKTADKRLYYKDDTGTEIGPLNSGSGGGSSSGPVGTLQASSGSGSFSTSGLIDNGTTLSVARDLVFQGPNPFKDIRAYGARSVTGGIAAPGFTANCTNSSPSVTLSSAGTFQNGDGVVLFGCGSANTLSTPSAPTVTPDLAGSGTGTGLVVAGLTGATTYNYQIVARTKTGALTAASSVGTTSTGAASLGSQSVTLTSCSRTNATVTCTTSGAHGLTVGAQILTTGTSDDFGNGDFAGLYTVVTVPDTTHFTFTSGMDSRNGADTAATGGTVYWFNCNHLTWTAVTGAFEYYIYGRTGGSLTLLGVSHPQPSGNTNYLYWDDFGATMMGNIALPYFVPSTPPTSATNNNLSTTVVSGAGTTTLTLGNAAGATVTGAGILFDNAPAILAAANAVIATGGSVYIPAGATFVVNSYLQMPSFSTVTQLGALTLNDTLQAASGGKWAGDLFPQPASPPSFAFQGVPNIFVGQANPGIFADSGANNVSFSHVQIGIGGGNAYNLMFYDQVGEVLFDTVNLSIANGTQDYMGIPLIIGGLAVNTSFPIWMRNVTISTGPNQVTGASVTPSWWCNYCGTKNVESMYLNRRGIFETVGGTPSSFRIHWAREQGGITPFYTVSSQTAGSTGGFLDFTSIGLDTMTFAAIANQSALSDSYVGSVRLNGLATGSAAPFTGAAFTGGITTNAGGGQNFDILTLSGNVISQGQGVYVSGQTGTNSPAGGQLGFLVPPLAAPGAVVSSGGAVPTNINGYGVTGLDTNGNETLLSVPASVTVSTGNQTVTVTPVAFPPGIVSWKVYRGASGAFAEAALPSCVALPVTTTSYTDSSGSLCGASPPSPPSFASESVISKNGVATPALVLSGGAFTNTLAGTFTAARTAALPDNSGYVPVSGYVNSAYDNATRANGVIGANWTVTTGGINVASNSFQGTGATNEAFWNVNPFAVDEFAEATVTALNAGTDFIGPSVRVSSGGNWYSCVESNASLIFQRSVAGTTANLVTQSITGAVGDVLRIEMQGSTAKCYQNGVLLITQTDTNLTSGSPGMEFFGTIATLKNWSGGNVHPLAQLDAEQDFAKTQHFTQGVAFGTETFTASPRGVQDAFLPGALTSTWTGSTWTLDKAISVTRLQVQAKTAPSGCATNAVVRLTDGTSPVNLTISAAASDSGPIVQNYAAGASLTIAVQTAAAGCTTSPADANVTVQYRMQ